MEILAEDAKYSVERAEELENNEDLAMAYFIDETGNRGLKAEGKLFFAWNVETRKFSAPVDDAPPKSRMRRCSEFEAKYFNFLSDGAGWEVRIHDLARVASSFSDDQLSSLGNLDVEFLREKQRQAEEFRATWLPQAKEAADAAWRFGVMQSEIGRLASQTVASMMANVALPTSMLKAIAAGEKLNIKLEEQSI